MAYLKSGQCLVRIKYADEISPRFVTCVEISTDKWTLIIPLEDYPTVVWGQQELECILLRSLFVISPHPDYEYECLELIDLDDTEELPTEQS